MKVKRDQRSKLVFYLKEFYKRFPEEKHTVFHFVKAFKNRLKNNRDAWMGVSGETGTGKSYGVMIFQILFGRPYDLTKNIAYIPKGNEIMDMFDKLTFNTLLIDEAAREMRSVNWQSKSQQGVNTKAMTDRFKNNWVFLNMPSFNEFTKSMRQGNIVFRAVLPYRTKLYARVIIQRKSRNWRSDDPWSDEVANKKYEKMEKKHGEITNESILKIERSLPNTIMDFIIPDLSLILPEVTDEYERLKMESRKVSENEELDNSKSKIKEEMLAFKSKIAKVLFYNELGFGDGKRMTKQMLADSMGMTVGTFNKFLKMDAPIEEKKPKSNFRKAEDKPTQSVGKESAVMNTFAQEPGATKANGDALTKAMLESRKS